MVKEIMYCDRCGKECEDKRNCHGFLIMRKTNGISEKLVLCQNCYNSLAKWMESGKLTEKAEGEEQRKADKGTAKESVNNRVIKDAVYCNSNSISLCY